MNDTNLFTRRYLIPGLHKANNLVASLSLLGKLVLGFLIILFAGSALTMLAQVNNAFIVHIPEHGGSFVEGIVGIPRFINPVLAVTDGDKDVTSLVYSGLLRQMPDGSMKPDLAQSYDVSDDGKVYAVRIRPQAVFQDGSPVTADDVIFTIQKVQDPEIKSPRRANWEGVVVEKINEREIRIMLQKPYAPFISNLDLGILPKRLWNETTAETFPLNPLNVNPVGSGPYQISSIDKDKNGSPTAYTLVSFAAYALGEPAIGKISLKFFADGKGMLDSYLGGEVDSINSISPTIAHELEKQGGRVIRSPLPRVFGVFFNQSKNSALAQKEVRQALSQSVDRNHIIDVVLRGYGSPLTEAVPASYVEETGPATSTQANNIEVINTFLDKNGWTKGDDGIRTKKIGKDTVRLEFSITTSDASELKEVADILVREWREIGASVTIKVLEGGYLNQDIIKPRNYEALLFGQVVNRDLDLYAFWHSSQRSDPGINIALYSNKRVDNILETLRITSDKNTRLKEYQKFNEELANDIPAVFLYSPDFIYVAPKKIQGLSIGLISASSERFENIHDWYIETDRIWKIFLKTNSLATS